MLEKIVGYLKAFTSKKAVRAAFVVVTVISVVTGYLVLDSSSVVSGGDLQHIDPAYGEIKDTFNSTDIAVTDEVLVSENDVADSPLEVESEDETGDDGEQPVVTIKYETVTETVKFSYKTVYSDEMLKGESKVTKGKNGTKEVIYCVTMSDGEVISREVESEKVTKEPVAQVETIGTKLNSANAVTTSAEVKCISELTPSKPIELDKNGIPVNYKKVITGKGSAYSQGNSTSTGVTPKPGYVAVNPKQIPYGTKMYIVSADGKYVYGYAIAADTGGFATNGSGRIVDLRFNTKSECYTFGVRDVKIYILE